MLCFQSFLYSCLYLAAVCIIGYNRWQMSRVWKATIKRIKRGSRSPMRRGNFWGKGLRFLLYRDFLPRAVQKRLNRSICHLGGQMKHSFNRIHQVAPMCPHGRAHWRHLANTIEPSVCSGDVILCQITLTTCCVSDA